MTPKERTAYRIEVGKRLKSERKRLGLTQEELATACKRTGATQSLYEKGERTPNAEYLHLAREEFGLRQMYVLFGDDSAQAPRVSDYRRLYVEVDHASRDRAGRLKSLEDRADLMVKMAAEQGVCLPEEAITDD